MNELLPWHRDLWQRLRKATVDDRLPHAILLTGIEGLGKNQFADMTARSLLCGSPDDNGLPCGECRSCRFVDAGGHPDFFSLEPEESGKPIKIDAVRELVAWSVLTPQEGARRVALISPADAMNTAAANSLLKTLEEPPSALTIILVTARPAILPATIRSRCQAFTVQRPAQSQALDWLNHRDSTDVQGAPDWELLLQLAKGAPLCADRLAREGHLESRALRLKELKALLDGRVSAVDIASRWSSESPEETIDTLGSWLRDMVRLRMGAWPELLENSDIADTLQKLGESLDLRKLLTAGRAAETGVQNWRHGNLNLQMQIEDLLIDFLEGRK